MVEFVFMFVSIALSVNTHYRAWGASDDHVAVDDANRERCCPVGGGPTTP